MKRSEKNTNGKNNKERDEQKILIVNKCVAHFK